MSQRLPIVGSDDDTWGSILNAYLSVSLYTDGTLNPNTVGSSQIQNNAVGTNQIASNAVTNAQLDSPTQSTLAAVAGKYTLPGGGIPSTDMTSAVQTSLSNANSAVQSVNGHVGTSVTVTASDVSAVPTSSLGASGGVATLTGTTLTSSQLPTSVVNVSSPSSNQVPVWNGSEWIGGSGSSDWIAVKQEYGAKGGAKQFSSGATVSGTSFQDTVNAPFASTDVGKTINIPGTGTSGTNYSTTIAAYVSTSHVTLTAAGPNLSGITGAYQYGWNDTTAIQNALNAAGTVTIDFEGDAYMVSSLTVLAGVTLWGYGSTLITIAGTVNPTFNGGAEDGETLSLGFQCMGFTFLGEGVAGYTYEEAEAQDAILLQQWQNIVIRDNSFVGWQDGAVITRDSARIWIEDNQFTNCCIFSGRNVIDISDAPQGNASTLPVTDIFIRNNYIDNCAAAGISVASGYIDETTPYRCLIEGNRVRMNTGGFACISHEINYPGRTQQITIANNNLYIDNDEFGGAIFIGDDGGSPAADETKVQDYIITGNTLVGAGGDGLIYIIGVQRAIIANNKFVNTCTASAQPCICITQVPTSIFATYITISDNQFVMTAASVSDFIDLTYCEYVMISDNLFVGSSTATGGYGINVGTNCQFMDIAGNRFENTAWAAIFFGGAMQDVKVHGNTIHDPNEANYTGAEGAGICVYDGVGGTRNVISSNLIYDDRGIALMTYAVCVASATGAGVPFLLNNTMSGAAYGIINDSSEFTRIHGNDTDTPHNFPDEPFAPTVPASGSAYTNPLPEDIEVHLYGGTGTVCQVNRYTSGTTWDIWTASSGTAFAAHFTLRPGDSYTPTYTSAPTATAFPVP